MTTQPDLFGGDLPMARKPLRAEDVLHQVLEIIYLFADENAEMCNDILLCDPADRRRLAARKSPPDNAEVAVMLGEVGRAHAAMVQAAHNIGDTIRERFGLPKKED